MFSAYTDKAYHWFHSGPSNHWYRSYGVGLSLRIPIFDGLDKRYKMRKATIDIENIKLAQENTRKNLQTQYLNATNDLMNSQRNFKKQKDNYLLAEDVYTVTMDLIGKESPQWPKYAGRNADERSPKQLYQCPLQLPDNQSDFAEADGTAGDVEPPIH